MEITLPRAFLVVPWAECPVRRAMRDTQRVKELNVLVLHMLTGVRGNAMCGK